MPNKTPKVAIVANKNARSITPAIIKDLRDIITDEVLFLSESAKTSKKNSETIIQEGFDVVMCAGGDGTFSQVITEIINLAKDNIPIFGVLRLGTGNGVAEALRVAPHSKQNLLKELQQAKNPEARFQMPVLRINNRYAPFAGTGLDVNIIRDYNIVRKALNAIPFIPENRRGLADYAIAITTISLWKYALRSFPKIVIKNGGSRAHRIDFHGKRVGKPKLPGEVLYRGPASFAACSTVPYYGFDIPIFPQVTSLHGDYFQLRVTSMNVFEVVDARNGFKNLMNVLTGKLSHEKLWDFSCKEVIIETDGQPVQIGGDTAGKYKKIRINSIKIQAVQGSAAAAPEPPK